MVDTLGAGQDNVVFLGRRSFRMELVDGSAEDGRGIPKRSSEVPTEKIFESDRERATQEALASLRSREGISNTTLVTLCSTTFALGIALTLMVSGRPQPRRSLEAPPAGPASTVVIPPVAAPPTAAAAEPVVVSLPPPPALPALRRPPLARPARAVRPRPVPATRSVPAAPTPWVDPFAE